MERRCARAGLTLVEVIVVMVITSFLVLVLGAIYIQSLNMYADTMSRNVANERAQLALARLEEDIRGAFRIVEAKSDRITISQMKLAYDPSVGSDVPVLPLQHGARVRYFRSRGDGIYDPQGAFLWRATSPSPSQPLVADRDPLAEGITDFQLQYSYLLPPNDSIIAGVTITMTVQFKEFGHTVQRTHSTTVSVRNAQRGTQ